MTLSRWKLMAGFLGLSVGGLAMCCAQTSPTLPALPIPQKLDVPEISLTLPPPKVEVKPSNEKEIEIVLPILTPPKPQELVPVKAETKVIKVSTQEQKNLSPITTPISELPGVSGNYEPPTPFVNSQIKTIEVEIPVPAPKTPAPTPIEVEIPGVPAPKTPAPPANLDSIGAPPSIKPEPAKVGLTPPPISEEPKVPAKLIVTEAPAPVAKPVPKPEVKPDASGAKLKMLLRMGTGTPRFEIRSTTSEELLFKVYGDKIEMQSTPDTSKNSPLAGVTATGKVRFTGPGVEGTCDSLTLLSGTGEVLMKGNVQLKTKTGRTWSELAAEKMMYQIGLTGLKATTNPVTPTSFRE